MTAYIIHGISAESAGKAIAAAMHAAGSHLQAGIRLEISLVSVVREANGWRATLRVETSADEGGLPAHRPEEPPQDEAEAQEKQAAKEHRQSLDKARRARYEGLEGRDITPELLYELRNVPLDDLPRGLAEKIYFLMLAQNNAASDETPARPEADFAAAARQTVGQLVNIQTATARPDPAPSA